MIWERFFDFYTHHAVIYHLLFMYGLISSSYYIAQFVLIMGTLVQLYNLGTINDGTSYMKTMVFASHILPALYIESKGDIQKEVKLLFASILFYLFYTSIVRRVNIFKIYKNPYFYLYKY